MFLQELEFNQKTATHLTIQHVASVTGCWTTFDPHVLPALSDHHVWTDDFLSSRLKWRPKQPITVMELRCRQLHDALVIPSRDTYWGCFPWVELEHGVENVDIRAAASVIEDSDFKDRQQCIRRALDGLDDCTEVFLS